MLFWKPSRFPTNIHTEHFTDIFEQDGCSELYAVLQGSYKIRVRQFDDVQVVGSLHVLHPLVRLALRIDHQWPTTCIARLKYSYVVIVDFQQIHTTDVIDPIQYPIYRERTF